MLPPYPGRCLTVAWPGAPHDALQAEAAYTKAVLADTEELQEQLYKEMRGRIQESDQSAPVRCALGAQPDARNSALWPPAPPAGPCTGSFVKTESCVAAARRFQRYFYYTRTEEGKQYAGKP